MDSLQLRIVHWVWQTGGLKLIHKLVRGLKHNGCHKWKWKSKNKIKFTTLNTFSSPVALWCSCFTILRFTARLPFFRGQGGVGVGYTLKNAQGNNPENPICSKAELNCKEFKFCHFDCHKLRWKHTKQSRHILIHFPLVYFLN